MTPFGALIPADLIRDDDLFGLILDWPHQGRDRLAVTVQPLNAGCCASGPARAWTCTPDHPVTVLRHNGAWSSEFASPRAGVMAEHDRTGGTR